MGKMPTKIYIAVNGTCTAGPDDNLFSIFEEIALEKREREFSKKLNRPVSGGSTVLWVRNPEGVYMIDSGDVDDRSILEKSLAEISKEENISARHSVGRIYHSHLHPDHIGNNDAFPYANWMADARDPMLEVALGKREYEQFDQLRFLYEGHRARGITSDKFLKYDGNKHKGKPSGLTIIDSPGHDVVNKSFHIKDDEIVVINLEIGEEHKANRIVFTSDSICDERYLQRALNEDFDVRKTAVYGNKIPTDQWWLTNDPAERARMDAQNIESNAQIIKAANKGGLIIFGHGGVYDIAARK